MHFPELKLRRGWVRGLTWMMLLTQRLWSSSSTHTLRYAPGTSTCGARSQSTVKGRPEAWLRRLGKWCRRLSWLTPTVLRCLKKSVIYVKSVLP